MNKEAIEKTMVGGLPRLLSEGFECSKFTCTESKASGIFFTACYEAKRYRREISISYFPKFQRMTASIINSNGYFDFSDAGSMDVQFPKFEDLEGEPEARLKDYFQKLEIELTSKYLNILKGAPFENDKFDWSPYK